MQLKHSFTVPTGLEQAWQVLLDIERIAPCMPGAAIESVDGDDFTGTVKVRLGPIGLTYKGKASFVEKDAAAHRAVIDAQGKDTRGNGTAKARITATLTAQGEDGTAVEVVTDLNITGKPAQFGRGVMVDVGNKLIGQFADCLAGQLSGPGTGGEDTAGLGGAGSDSAGVSSAGSGSAEAGSAGSGSAGSGSAGSGSAGSGSAGSGSAGSGSAGSGSAGSGSAGSGSAGSGSAGLGSGDRATVERLADVDPATVERLANADLEGAEQLGTADPDTAELGVSAPDADRSAVARGDVEIGAGAAVPEQSMAGGAGLAEPGVVEAGLAELRSAPTVSAASSIAGPGLADVGAAEAPTGMPAEGAAVVAVPGPAPEEAPIEPDAAAEAAPTASPTLAQSPAHRPAVADVEPIDLLASAGPAVAKRLAPVLAGVLLVLLVVLRGRRRAASRAATRQATADYHDYQAAVRRWVEAERRAVNERRLSRTAKAGPPRPAPDWRAWPALRTGGRPVGRARRRPE